MNTFYLTTPLYYPNARPHVGSAYTTIVCDVLARYKRMCGYDVAFLTGTDEHGEKLQRAAEAAGQSPSEFVAGQRQLFVELWKKLGIEYNYFVYTDEPDHVTSVQRLLIRAREHGHIEKRRYEGRYCIYDEMYVSEGSDPINCPNCGRPTELISEDNYFFKLEAFKDRLLDHYEKHPRFVRPDFRMNEVKNFVKGLRDISVSRKRIKWGIPWPDDPEQVFYVWYDALTGYMTGIGYADGDEGNATFRKYWRNMPGEAELVHMIGKDILRFHAVYWPAFIMAAYPDRPDMLPTTVFAHGWIYYEQDKMSKSKGNVVYPEPIVEALDSLGAPGNDALRYYLLREAPFGQDTSFSYEALIQRYNSDLANDLGNLVNRSVTMIDRYCQGRIPHPTEAFRQADGATAALKDIVAADVEGVDGKGQYFEFFDAFQLSRSLDLLWNLVGATNKYLVHHAPWKVSNRTDLASVAQLQLDADGNPLPGQDSEGDRGRLNSVLYTAADMLRIVAAVAHPVLPQSAARVWKQLGCEGEVKNHRVDQLKWGGLAPGTKVGKPEPIFPRVDKAKALARLEEYAEADRLRSEPKGALVSVPEQPSARADSSSPAAPQNDSSLVGLQGPESVAPSPGSTQSSIDNRQSTISSPESRAPSPEKITIDDFAKVDLRAGTILSAEAIPGAKKLLKLQVDIGSEVRQVCAGIAEFYRPEELIGMKIVLVANLAPRKLRGIESNGMVVAASIGAEGKPVLATFKEDVPNGARLK